MIMQFSVIMQITDKHSHLNYYDGMQHTATTSKLLLQRAILYIPVLKLHVDDISAHRPNFLSHLDVFPILHFSIL